MDLIQILKGVKNLNDYICITQELNQKYKNVKISLNMSTVLSLKTIRSLEIEYFNKCHESGAAFNIFGRILILPPSKTWSLLGKELVSLLQYWLDAVRKHLISHHLHWWSFLKILLQFIKELLKKEHTLNNTLVKELSDSLLDLATRGRTNVLQRHEILHTFNQYCAESSRETRLALKMEFDHYFVRLSTMMASCGHLPTQYSTLETLLRWLLPRRDPYQRQEAAARWLPDHLYSNAVRQVFLERPWMNFFQDSRDLLNAHNQSSNDVTSVICRKLSIGETSIVSGTEKRPAWLDLNCGSGSLSILLDPKALEAMNVTEYSGCEVILITNDNIRAAKLYRESVRVLLSITTLEPPKLFPSCVSVLDSCDVTAVVSGRSQISRMDAALHAIFQDKYQVLMDVEDETTLSSPERSVNYYEEDTRFSHPAGEFGRRGRGGRSGCTIWSVNAASLKSPSTASTTSLAQLHDKLAALPHYRFDKEPVSVCAQPKLSRLTELSESDDKQSLDNTRTTLKLEQSGVTYHSRSSNKCQSDNEVKRPKKVTKSKEANDKQVDEKPTEKRKSKSDSEEVNETKNYSEIAKDIRNASLLLVATVGSADESVINDTLERLTAKKDYSSDNIVNLLIKEALQGKAAHEEGEKCLDSGINTDEDGKKAQDIVDAIENTPDVKKPASLRKENKYTIINKSTSTDESNTEAINDTPMCYVTVRKKKPKRTNSVDNNLPTISETTYEVQAVEEFFSQHFYKSNKGDLMISPTLARKINETSSENSDFGDCVLIDEEININIDQYEVLDVDIIECLNHMVDEVCHDFDRYLEQEKGNIVVPENISNTPLKDIGNTEELSKSKLDSKGSEPTKKRGMKLNYNLNTTNKKTKPTKKKPKSKNKLELEPAEMSFVVFNKEIHEETQVPKSPKMNTTPENKGLESCLPRRKRKLYSPKDENIITTASEHAELDISVPLNKDNEEPQESDNDDITISELKKRNNVAPKTTATSYIDIEKDRKRIRKSRAKNVASPKSPKTRKLDEVFDHLKENIECNEKITLADKKDFDKDMAIFNFTSDSEDEDFKKKKVDLQKRISTTTIDSGNSVISRRERTRTKVDYKGKEKGSNDETVKPTARRRCKRQKSKTKTSKTPKVIKVDGLNDLVDEKIRETALAKETALETSLVVEKTNPESTDEPDPAIQIPEIELVTDDEINTRKVCDAIEENKRSKKKERVAKKEKVTKTAALEVAKDKDDEGTISPLPGLLVEKVTPQPNYEDSIINSNFVHKVKKMYKTGEGLCANDANTTQSLLSDNEKTIHSLQMSITDEFKNIQDVVEDNACFSVKASNEIGLENKYHSEISLLKLVEFHNENEHVSDNDNKSAASSKSKLKKRNLRLKSSETANQSDSDTKCGLRSLKTTSESTKNNVDLNLQNEIICIDDDTSNNISQPKIDKNNEVIEIFEDEKSISTDGITAHGDLTEDPPSQKSLEQPLLHREMADMEESILDYFVKLRKEIDNSRRNSNETVASSQRCEVKAKDMSISPVISLTKMTPGEIRKWTSSPISKEDEDYDYRRWLPSQKDSDFDKNSKSGEKSPCVSLTRLSSKEIDEWINKSNSNKSYPESRVDSSENANMSPILKKSSSRVDSSENANMSPILKKSSSRVDSSDKANMSPILKKSSSRVDSSDKANMSPILKKSISNKNENINDPSKYKSLISPIRFDFSKQEYLSKIVEEKAINETSSEKESQSQKPSTPKERKFDNDVSSPDSKSTSRSIHDSNTQNTPVKRSLPEAEETDVKRRKVEVNVSTESGTSASSVEDWLDHSEEGLLDDSIADILQNIMERLDTTVKEIHQNTNKNFVKLFVEAQRRLDSIKTEQHAMLRQAADNILTSLVKIIDDQFSDIDQKSQKVQIDFMENLKQQTIEFIKTDSKKKREMVRLLQEEVEAALKLHQESRK